MPTEFSPKVPAENSPLRYVSVAPEATWRRDGREFIEIEVDDGLEGLGGGAAAKAVGQGVVPGGIFGLQGEQFGDRVTPSLWSGTSICRSSVADRRRRLLGLPTGAIVGLSFGVAKGVIAGRLATSWHGMFSVT